MVTLELMTSKMKRKARPFTLMPLRANILETSLVLLVSVQGEIEKGSGERDFSRGSVLGGCGWRGGQQQAISGRPEGATECPFCCIWQQARVNFPRVTLA